MRLATIKIVMGWLLILACVCSCAGGGSRSFPEELVGVWADEDAVFNGEQLVLGGAVYLTAHGTGAIGVITRKHPGVGSTLLASYDPDSSSIYYILTSTGAQPTWERIVFDPVKQTLIFDSQPDKPLYRRFKMLPKNVIEHCGPELWEQNRDELEWAGKRP